MEGATRNDVAGLFELLRLRRAAARAFEPLGFTFYEATLLLLVGQGAERPYALIRELDVQATAVSALVTKLARAGLLTRDANEHDGRSVCVRLTAKGRAAVRRIEKGWAEQNAEPSSAPDTRTAL